MPNKPRKGFQYSSRGGGRGIKSSLEQLEKNPYFSDPGSRDFTDANFDANEQLPFAAGGGSNWFTRLFNPPSQEAIAANNAYLADQVGRETEIQDELKRKGLADEEFGRNLVAYLTQQKNLGMIPSSVGSSYDSIGSYGKQALGNYAQQGMIAGIPSAELTGMDLSQKKDVLESPEGQRFNRTSILRNLVPDTSFQGGVYSPAQGLMFRNPAVQKETEYQEITDTKSGQKMRIPQVSYGYTPAEISEITPITNPDPTTPRTPPIGPPTSIQNQVPTQTQGELIGPRQGLTPEELNKLLNLQGGGMSDELILQLIRRKQQEEKIKRGF